MKHDVTGKNKEKRIVGTFCRLVDTSQYLFRIKKLKDKNN
jgi:hypothetical protein